MSAIGQSVSTVRKKPVAAGQVEVGIIGRLRRSSSRRKQPAAESFSAQLDSTSRRVSNEASGASVDKTGIRSGVNTVDGAAARQLTALLADDAADPLVPPLWQLASSVRRSFGAQPLVGVENHRIGEPARWTPTTPAKRLAQPASSYRVPTSSL